MEQRLLPNPVQLALQYAGWIDATVQKPIAVAGTDDCLLRSLLSLESRYPLLTRNGAKRLKQLVDVGWMLRASWPRAWSDCVSSWLGSRFFFGHASQLKQATSLTSIVSSQLGRHGRDLPHWPRLMESALRFACRNKSRMLICPGTTLAEIVEHFCLTAGLPTLKALCDDETDFSRWFLHHALDDSLIGQRNTDHEILFISPATGESHASLSETPLQDRLAIVLADRVFSCKIRPAGNLETLVDARLTEARFPCASLMVALDHTQSLARQRRSAQWLSRGAVGWLLSDPHSCKNANLVRCNSSRMSARLARHTQQICSALPGSWHTLHEPDDWPYLVHCTRGLLGPLPEESIASYRNRVLVLGDSIQEQPLETLARICKEQRLRASSTITRTPTRCVSLSAVPLVPLLHRRQFRSHLNRWDWEPYGLLIRRNVLVTMGAQQVLYGGEKEFDALSSEQRPFFQPVYRKNPNAESWASEREWRIIDDLRLDRLPFDSVLIFVRTQFEARQFARTSPWPVLWVE